MLYEPNSQLQDVFCEYFRARRQFPASGGAATISVLSMTDDERDIVVELRLLSGRRYCCGELLCHAGNWHDDQPVPDGKTHAVHRWQELRDSLAKARLAIRAPISLTIRLIVEPGALLGPIDEVPGLPSEGYTTEEGPYCEPSLA